MNIITGYRGEPHITSSQDRAGNQGSYGTGSYVLDVGNKLAATISSSTQVRIADGAICHQGCLANIDAGTYDAVTINNGAQGVNRIDLIVARYTKDGVTGAESIDLVVIQGSSVSGTPTPPSYRTGNIQNGDSPVDMPLYQVRLTGVTLSSVTKVFNTVKTQAELQADVSTLNSKSNVTLPANSIMLSPAIITKNGNVCSFQYGANITIAAGAWRELAGYIPEGYRPSGRRGFNAIFDGTANAGIQGYIEEHGTMWIKPNESVTNRAIYFGFTYVL